MYCSKSKIFVKYIYPIINSGCAENPLYAKFRNKRLSFAHKLTKFFKDVIANGEFQRPPSSRILPVGVEVDMNNVYRPSLDGIGINVEESLGDSEDASVSIFVA